MPNFFFFARFSNNSHYLQTARKDKSLAERLSQIRKMTAVLLFPAIAVQLAIAKKRSILNFQLIQLSLPFKDGVS